MRGHGIGGAAAGLACRLGYRGGIDTGVDIRSSLQLQRQPYPDLNPGSGSIQLNAYQTLTPYLQLRLRSRGMLEHTPDGEYEA
ncbi:hypothetical protein PZA11_005792 [Diplocarpon coronariae]